jgi:hypothetical protein
MAANDRSPNLLSWQWALYARGHRRRATLAVHALTVPLFCAGGVVVVAAPFVTPWLAVAGVLAMGLAIAAQGRTHAREPAAPVPFSGPGDFVARIFFEQWITFPRFVLSGAFARAWRDETPADA